MLPSALLPAASKIQIRTFYDFQSPDRRVFWRSSPRVITPRTRNSLLWIWSISQRKLQAGFNRATIPWQNTFSLTTTVNGNSCKRAINTRGNLVFRWRIYHPKEVLAFSFLLFVYLLLHFVSSVPSLICKQLVRKEVFPVVARTIANCSQSSISKQ